MEYKISSNNFWNKLRCHYPVYKNWHLKDARIQKISKSLLGLKFINTEFSDQIDKPYNTYFKFEIINKEKFLWAQLKYDL
jgi:hypothetical protein